MALRVLTIVWLMTLILTGCSSEAENTTDPDITIPDFDPDVLEALPATGSLADFPGVIDGFSATNEGILLIDEQPCVAIQSSIIPNNTAIEDAVTLLIDGEPVSPDTVDTQSEPGIARYCYTVEMFAENYNADLELVSTDGRTSYGWDFSSGLPIIQPLHDFPGDFTGLDLSTSPIQVNALEICMELRDVLLNLTTNDLPVQIRIDNSIVERDRIDVEQNGSTTIYCLALPSISSGMHTIDITLDVAAASSRSPIQRYRGEFEVDDIS